MDEFAIERFVRRGVEREINKGTSDLVGLGSA
jgi:hypothetical protein